MIELYTSKDCTWCRKMKSYLESKDAKFIELDVGNPENAKKAYEISGQRVVPITVIGESIIIGFDRDAVDELIG